jgi:hypothetical protein
MASVPTVFDFSHSNLHKGLYQFVWSFGGSVAPCFRVSGCFGGSLVRASSFQREATSTRLLYRSVWSLLSYWGSLVRVSFQRG